MNRNMGRRLKRLEAHIASETDPISFRIQFIDSMIRVASTLLLESGKQVWTNLEDENAGRAPTSAASQDESRAPAKPSVSF
ncbi:MAG: hypothetical protein JWO19_1700 [Bryobacterales bacterium]|nr:hypothetical protein [Bryobacterales bacterium]